MDVYFYYLLNNESNLIEVVEDVENEGFASIPFFSTIQGKNAVYTYFGHGYDYIGVWYVVVKDQYSEIKSPEWIFTTRHVPIDNEKPTANSGGPYSGEINEIINFDGSNCYDTDGSIEFYRWSFGDNTSVTNVQSPTHTYSTSGRKQVSLIVIDDQGSSNTHSTYVDIEVPQDDPPIANAGGPYTITEGESVILLSVGSYDPDPGDSISSFKWYFGDNTNSTEENPVHIYSTAGNYSVTLVLTDTVGLEGIDTTYVLVVKPEETPGFEIIILFIAVISLLVFARKRK
jgi:PKD repeat protein